MKEMQIFENQEFGAVRTVELDGEPWLVGKDERIFHAEILRPHAGSFLYGGCG